MTPSSLANTHRLAKLMTLAQGKLARAIGITLLAGGTFGLVACDNANSSTVAKNIASQPATTAVNDTQLKQKLSANLAKSGIEAKVLSVTPTPMPNMYWVKVEGLPAFFTDSTGQYIVQGDIIKVGSAKPVRVSEDLLAKDAKDAIATIDKKDMIIFPAKGKTKAVIDVFTDTDCPYCRKLHSEIEQINALGIEVRYLPWPRSEQTFPIMEAIWCSSDRKAAMTQAAQGMAVNSPQCANPVRKIHDLGISMGINGTPAIYDQNGRQLGGYLPAAELAKALNI